MLFEVYIVHNGYISHIVSYNSSITLRFKELIIISNSYTHQIWTQPYIYNNTWKFEVTLPIVVAKTCFSTFNLGGRK